MEDRVLSPCQIANSRRGSDFRIRAHDRTHQFCRLKRAFATSDKLQTPGRQRLALVRGDEAKTKIENPRTPDIFDRRGSIRERQNSPRSSIPAPSIPNPASFPEGAQKPVVLETL